MFIQSKVNTIVKTSTKALICEILEMSINYKTVSHYSKLKGKLIIWLWNSREI